MSFQRGDGHSGLTLAIFPEPVAFDMVVSLKIRWTPFLRAPVPFRGLSSPRKVRHSRIIKEFAQCRHSFFHVHPLISICGDILMALDMPIAAEPVLRISNDCSSTSFRFETCTFIFMIPAWTRASRPVRRCYHGSLSCSGQYQHAVAWLQVFRRFILLLRWKKLSASDSSIFPILLLSFAFNSSAAFLLSFSS